MTGGQAFTCAAEGCENFMIHFQPLDPFGPLAKGGWRVDRDGSVYCPEHATQFTLHDGDMVKMVSTINSEDWSVSSEVITVLPREQIEDMREQAEKLLELAHAIGMGCQRLFHLEYASNEHMTLYRTVERIYDDHLKLTKAWQEAYGDENWNDYAA